MAQIKLYDKARKLVLSVDDSKEINRGGEGAIYQSPVDKNIAIKVYHPGISSSLNLPFMEDLRKLGPEFIRPIDIFYKSDGRTVAGFSMKYLKTAKMFLLSTLTSKALCQKEGFDEGFKKKIFQKIRASLIEAHKAGINIGDLNPYNIYFTAKEEVYFIDTDSYQTPNKKHSDVVLPDVRDWLSVGISDSTDFYAYAILAFQAMTALHPFKGIHKKYKTLEERSVRLISVLSGDKDLVIPAFYDPITTPTLAKDFYAIFQEKKRFMVDLVSMPITARPVVAVTTYSDKSVTIKLLSSNSGDFGCSQTIMYFIEGDKAILANCQSKQTIQRYPSISKPDLILCSTNGFVAVDRGNAFMIGRDGSKSIVHNLGYMPEDVVLKCGENIFTVLNGSTDDSYMIYDFGTMLNGRANARTGSLFVPSVEPNDNCCVQNVAGMRWILNFDQGYLQTVRTNYDVRRASYYGGWYMLEIWEKKVPKYYLAKVYGLTVELGEEFSSWRSFTRVGDTVMVAADEKIIVFSDLGRQKIAEIDCSVITEQSVIKYCNAGILCQTGSNLYLINKI